MLGPFPPALTIAVPFVVAALTGLLVRRHWWRTRVTSWSMYPTLSPGAVFWTRRLSPGAPVHRGDIMVIDLPEPAAPPPGSKPSGPGRCVVKRVIGLPGETVQVTADQVLIDGTPLAEPYVAHRGGPTGVYQVPADSYFVLGDNRALSSDSRAWKRPFVPRSALKGISIGVGKGLNSGLGAAFRPQETHSDKEALALPRGRGDRI